MKRTLSIVWVAAALTVIWASLSGKIDLLHLGTGAVAALALAIYYSPSSGKGIMPLVRFAKFIPWQLWQIFISNLHVARLVLSRRLAIAPRLIRRSPGVEGDAALTVLGASITLTPGTLTVEAADDHILIHSLDAVSLEGVEQGVIAGHVRRIFSRNN